MMPDNSACPFCSPFGDDIIARNSLCYARWDRFPVSKGHLLVIPFRHTPDYFTLTPEEKAAMVELIDECRMIIEDNFTPGGYNIGYNAYQQFVNSVYKKKRHPLGSIIYNRDLIFDTL
jgi:diadenosine tetraphosphate (Ap4A) HIT family hydrolase